MNNFLKQLLVFGIFFNIFCIGTASVHAANGISDACKPPRKGPTQSCVTYTCGQPLRQGGNFRCMTGPKSLQRFECGITWDAIGRRTPCVLSSFVQGSCYPNKNGCDINECFQPVTEEYNYICSAPAVPCQNGFLCDGTPVTGTHNQVVCGGDGAGGNVNYICKGNGNWASQGTFCNLCGQSITTNSISAYPDLYGSLGWTAVGNITRYRLRIDDAADGWIVSGQCPNGWTGFDYCSDVATDTNSFNWTATAGHSYHWWVDACGANDVCTAASSADVTAPSAPNTSTPTPIPPTSTPTPTDTPTPTPTPAVSYFKLKNASFYKLGTLTSIFPSTLVEYDSSDDIAGSYFNQGPSAGVVVSQTGTITAGGNLGSSVSQSGWKRSGQNIPSSFNSAAFKKYVLTKKAITKITNPDISAINSAGIYYYDGDLDNLTNGPSADNVLLLVNGNVTVVGTGAVNKSFNSSARPFALVVSGSSSSPKTLTFDDSLTLANGVFVADTVAFNTNSGSTTPLKIVGNVTSYTGVSMSPMSRARSTNTNAPSLFIVFDPAVYMGIFNQLSTVKSSWIQIQ